MHLLAFVNDCEKDQLVQIADCYGIIVAEKKRKNEITVWLNAVLSSLFEQDVLQKNEFLSGHSCVDSRFDF